MHSDMPDEAKREAMAECPADVVKVVLTTSMSESSVTIPEVKLVVDFCKRRDVVKSSLNGETTLSTMNASESEMNQRKGRAGRCSDGICVRLVPENFLANAHKTVQAVFTEEGAAELLLQSIAIGFRATASTTCRCPGRNRWWTPRVQG